MDHKLAKNYGDAFEALASGEQDVVSKPKDISFMSKAFDDDASENFRCTICVSEAGDQEALINVVYNQYKNYEKSNDVEDSDIVWLGRPFEISDKAILPKLNGFINRIHGCQIFREKYLQCWLLNQCKKYFPEQFKFHPQSYCLTKDYALLERDLSQSTSDQLWVAKESDSGDGDNIVIFKTLDELKQSGCVRDDMVVQQYISNPLLIRNKKWDARIYVILHGINPMKAYISTDCGIGRFCTEDYDISDTENIYSHLTNYSINKNSDKYVNYEEQDDHSTDDDMKFIHKMPMSQVWKLIEQEYPDYDINSLKEKIVDCARGMLRSCRGAIEVKSAEMLNMNMSEEENNKFFHIIGLDIMFDANLDIWLFETNRFPSMDLTWTRPNKDGVQERNRSIIDERLKGTLFNEACKILVGKHESSLFKEFYDSGMPDTIDHDFMYEKIMKVYRGLSGGAAKDALSLVDFSKIMTYFNLKEQNYSNFNEFLSDLDDKKTLNNEYSDASSSEIEKFDFLNHSSEESKFGSFIQRFNVDDSMPLTLMDLFDGLDIISEALQTDLISLLQSLD